jgi:aminoglycoside phosphotransferase (APT) family kinase protein
MMFGTTRNAPAISVVDWQGARLAPPLLDAAVFLGSCMTTEQRRAHEHDLLRAHLDGLRAGGISRFSFDDCLESYRRCSPWAFLGAILVSISIAQTARGDAMWARMVRGCADVVLDTGADTLRD